MRLSLIKSYSQIVNNAEVNLSLNYAVLWIEDNLLDNLSLCEIEDLFSQLLRCVGLLFLLISWINYASIVANGL